MDKTLSQDEVDALLQAVKSGGVEEEVEAAPRKAVEEIKIVRYDFRKPNLISADQARGFQMIHESFAKALQNNLLTSLKVPLEVKLVAVDTISYREFVLSLISPTVLTTLDTTPDIGQLALEFNPSIALCMIDVLLGGDGSGTAEARELTAIEQSMMGSVLDVVLADLKLAWAGTVDISFKARSFESSPSRLSVTTPEASVLNATFDLRTREVTGTMSLCYPFEMIQPVLSRVTARMSGQKDRTEKDRKNVLTAMGDVPLKMKVEVGRSSVLASWVAQLEQGDVICLDRNIDNPVDVFVDDKLCYQAELGWRRGKVAVKLAKHSLERQREDWADKFAKGKAIIA
jgi:flagellar motor switch protein FliM